MKLVVLSITACCALFVSIYAAEWCYDTTDCCVGKPNGTIMGNPYNFTTFYRCFDEIPTEFVCLNPLRPCFNNATDTCDSLANVPYCSSGGITTTTTTTTTTGRPVTPDCRPGEVHNVPVLGDCSKYMICVFGELLPEVHTCSEGLRFDAYLEGCNLEAEVQCTPPTCNPAINDTMPHTKVCSRYWNCTLGTLSAEECPPNQNFDAIDFACKPQDDAMCGNVCPDEGIDFEPHEDCSLYWLCVNSKPYLRECLGELQYDCVLKECAPAPIDASCACSNSTAMAPNFW